MKWVSHCLALVVSVVYKGRLPLAWTVVKEAKVIFSNGHAGASEQTKSPYSPATDVIFWVMVEFDGLTMD
ncbi:MAG: hypothetical protein H6632_13030 [Anaerolineales bacterium]|nr:hypothetical protein [Anaerolineales bacterium]